MIAGSITHKHEPYELYFSNLYYQINKGERNILNNINGKFPGGAFIAVLGPSGSGKTTLLNILSGYRYQNATVESLQINGTETDFEFLQSISCYITQDIHLNDLLTIEENMKFAADFKLGVTHSQLEKLTIIGEILENFGLSLVKENRAGKLSNGERKRLAIAMEMISDTKIIYLDEPTTGLDISTTKQILKFLKNLTESGKTVICTIHQVCAAHFELFDLAYVIADGQCAYQGQPQELVNFLDHQGLPCNIYHNPADYVIELCCGDFGHDKASVLIKASMQGDSMTKNRDREVCLFQRQSCTNITKIGSANASGMYKFKTLLTREIVKFRRNMFLTYLRLFGSNFLGAGIGIFFWDIGQDATKLLINYYLVFCMNATLIFSGIFVPILTFPLEMDLVKRETHNSYYSILHYYVAVALVDLPISLLTIVTSNFLIYFLSGQVLETHRIVLFLICSVILGTVINSFGFLFGTLMKLNNAIVFASLLQIPLILVSGFGLMIKDLHWLLEKISRFLYVRCGMMGIMVAIFGLNRRKLDCLDEIEYCYYTDSNRFIEDIGINSNDYVMNINILVAWLFVIRVVTYFSIKYRLSW